jgi:uncharacterized protein (TIGR03790 family)
LVIINQNSTASVQIGDHYCQKHNIPEENKILIEITEDETIDSMQFVVALQQIKAGLLAHPNIDQLNYLVTTKGLPLRVGDMCYDTLPQVIQKCSSFDSEIALLLSPDESKIGKSGFVSNPYFDAGEHFSRETYGFFIVTRLDGYTEDDIYDLIDRSGPDVLVDKDKAKFIFDISGNNSQPEIELFEALLEPAHNMLTERGWSSILHVDTNLITDEEDVLGFVGFIRETGYELNYSWMDGSVMSNAIGGTASTFNPDSASGAFPLMADLIEEGATGGEGVIFGTYASQLLKYEILFDHYTDSSDHYNLGESFYLAINNLSWQHVVIGDPKMSIVADNNTGIPDPGHEEIHLSTWPNPAIDVLHIRLSDPGHNYSTLFITDIFGRTIESRTLTAGVKQIELDVSQYAEGVYMVVVESAEGYIQTRKAIIQ